MQKIGEIASKGEGFTFEDLDAARALFSSKGLTCELVDLRTYLPESERPKAEGAFILIVRNGVDCVLQFGGESEATFEGDAHRFFEEQRALKVDTRAYMYGRVVNKLARHNLCFSETPQEPDYAQGRGRIVAYDTVPMLAAFRRHLPRWLGEKAAGLVVEGNYYYDAAACGIGYHGDAERRKVVAVRLGTGLPLVYQWYLRSAPVGERARFDLSHGDLYVMSEKATGCDWLVKTIYTLRHAAGAEKYITIKPKTKKKPRLD